MLNCNPEIQEKHIFISVDQLQKKVIIISPVPHVYCM